MPQTNTGLQLHVFVNPDFGEIRTTVIDGEPWLVGKDIAKALGYSNTKDAIGKHVDQDDKRGSRIATPSGTQQMTVINESGLYALILSSKLPSAKKFKRWVTSEVLPAIRKTGAYQMPGVEQRMTDFEIAEMIRDMPIEKMPAFFSYLRANGYKVPDSCYSPKALAKAPDRTPQANIVQNFTNEILPQSQWDLLPFGVVYDLYGTWHKRNSITAKQLGKNTFINILIKLADTGKLHDWTCPGRKHPIRPKHLMDAPEPVIAYPINPKHLIRKATYTGIIRI